MPPASWRLGWPQRQRAGQHSAHTQNPGDALHLTLAAPHQLSAVTGRGTCASMAHTHALNTAEQPWLYTEAHGASRQH